MNHLSNLSRGIAAIAVTLVILGSYADAGNRYGSRYLGYQRSTHGSLGYQYAGGLNYPNVCGATGYCLSDTGSTYFHRPYGNNFFSNHLRWRGDVDADTESGFGHILLGSVRIISTERVCEPISV